MIDKTTILLTTAGPKNGHQLQVALREPSTPPIQVYGFDPVSGNHGFYRVENFLEKHSSVVAVRYRFGDDISFSSDSPVTCYIDGRLQPLVVEHSQGLCAPQIKILHYPIKGFASEVMANGVTGRHMDEPREFSVPLYNETGLFTGMVVGNGWVDTADRLSLSTTRPELTKAFVDIVSSGFFPYSHANQPIEWEAGSLGGTIGRRGRVSVSSPSWFNRWVKGQIGDGALFKRIPRFCFSAPKAHLLGLLDGLLSTDGTVGIVKAASKKKPQMNVAYTTSSQLLVRQVRCLAKYLGISTSVTNTRSPISGRDAWVVVFSSLDMVKFVKRANFTLSHLAKNEALQTGLSLVNEKSSIARSRSLVPYPRHLHEPLIKAAATFEWENDKARKCAAIQQRNGLINFYWTRSTAERFWQRWIKDAPIETLDYARILCDKTVDWNPVCEIVAEPEEKEVFEVTLQGGARAVTLDGTVV